MRKSFILHLDSLSVLDELTDEQAGKLFKLLRDYHFNDNIVINDFGLKMAFLPFKNQFIRDSEKYNVVCDKNKNNGKKGGRPKKQEVIINPEEPKKPSGLNKNPEEPKKPDSDSDSKNDSDNNNENILLTKTDEIIKKPSIEKTWKNDFETYVQLVRFAYQDIVNDSKQMDDLNKFYPLTDIRLSLELSCKSFWATDEGWKNKKSKRTKDINMKSTLINSLKFKENRVYKPKN